MRVLDKGYVNLIDIFGNDLKVVNFARASFQKESKELNEGDKRLIEYLAKNGHSSPFRSCAVSLEIKAPIFVARQLYRHCVASLHLEDENAWNEASFRYISIEPEFYIPENFRVAPENKKQGSGDNCEKELNDKLLFSLNATIFNCVTQYNAAIEAGVANEMARFFLSSNIQYTTWRWVISLPAVINLLKQRLDSHAQYETQQYAKAIASIIEPAFPLSFQSLMRYSNVY